MNLFTVLCTILVRILKVEECLTFYTTYILVFKYTSIYVVYNSENLDLGIGIYEIC